MDVRTIKEMGSLGYYIPRNFVIYARTHAHTYTRKSTYTVSAVKSRSLRRAEHVATMGETRKAYTILVRNLLENAHLEDRGYERIILRYILGWRYVVWMRGGWN